MRIVIAGAGKVGRAIAEELVSSGHDVLLVDRDNRAIRPDSVPGAEWMCADACEFAALEEARLTDCDVVVAASGDDKVNLVVSLLAKTEYGVPKVVARVNHPRNEWMFDESWGVDVAVSQPRSMVALIEEAVAVGDVVRLMEFKHGNANLVELTLPDNSPAAGKRIGAINWPVNVAPVSIVRGDRVIAPTADDTVEVGDELLFVAPTQAEPALKQVLAPGN